MRSILTGMLAWITETITETVPEATVLSRQLLNIITYRSQAVVYSMSTQGTSAKSTCVRRSEYIGGKDTGVSNIEQSEL
jgi:hypothetical protein